MNIDFTLNQAYYVECGKLNPVAIRPRFTITNDKVVVAWEDTGRGFSVTLKTGGKEISEENISQLKTIELDTEMGPIRLRKLTKEIFDKNVKPIVSGGVDNSSDQAIQDHYLNTDFF